MVFNHHKLLITEEEVLIDAKLSLDKLQHELLGNKVLRCIRTVQYADFIMISIGSPDHYLFDKRFYLPSIEWAFQNADAKLAFSLALIIDRVYASSCWYGNIKFINM